jgi:radical SAM superfamily enzyme YgiQ (UPF0313 family)
VNITLIHPRFSASYGASAAMTPLAAGVLAALTPARHRVSFYDERLEEIPFGEPADLVAISTCTFAARRAYEIAGRFRARGVPVVLGGFHPTLMPGEAAARADAVAVGDAEGVWPRILADAEAGRARGIYRAENPGPAAPVAPDHSVYQGKRYLPVHLVQFARGCPRHCEFCAVRAFYGGGVAHRPVAEVVAELQACGKKRVFFVDDNLAGDRAACRELLAALEPLRLRWTAQADLSLADDPDMLELARRSGCECLVVGFESLAAANLRQMGKAWNNPPSFRTRLARLRRAGILVYGTFLFGYDADDPAAIARTLAFALRERLAVANFNPLQPLPGTPLFERYRREQRLTREHWWLDPGYRWHDPLVRPAGMSPAQLGEGCRRAREAFHSLAGILRRLPSRAHLRRPSSLFLFLAANWISRRDIQAKSAPR